MTFPPCQPFNSPWRHLVARTVIGASIAVASTSGLAAQALRGQALQVGTSTGLANATIVVRDAAATIVARVGSGSDGQFFLRLPAAGEYQIQVIRIGFVPIVQHLGMIAAGETRVVRVAMTEQPFELDPVSVVANDRCRMSRGERDRFIHVWQEARAALNGHITTNRGGVMMHAVEVQGTEDGPTRNFGNERIWNPNSRNTEVDSTTGRDFVSTLLPGSTPADLLHDQGYVAGNAEDGFSFEIPHPEALLSDQFLSRHCFSLTGGPSGHSDWIGLRFRPVDSDSNHADITGTFWLEPTGMLPRRVEYEYRNLPIIPYRSCFAKNRPARPVVGQDRSGPNCSRDGYGRLPTPREGVGGTVDFMTIEGEGWFVSEWLLRSPGTDFMDRYLGYRGRSEGGRLVRCSDRPPRCNMIFWAMPQLVLTTGMVVGLYHEGLELYRDPVAGAKMERIASLQSGRNPSYLVGDILHADGKPIPQAVISTSNPIRSAISDYLGRFEIRTLPPGSIEVRVEHPDFAPYTTRLVLNPDSTSRLSVQLRPATPRP